MLRLRLLLLVTVSWLVVTLNVERPDRILNLGHINLSPAFYLSLLIVMIIVLALPESGRFPTRYGVPAALALYWLFEFGVGSTRLSDKVGNYITYLEQGMLAASFVLARRFSRSIMRIEDTFNRMVVGAVDMDQHHTTSGEQAITHELYRARRYNYPVTLLYVRFELSPTPKSPLLERWNRTQMLEKYYFQAYVVRLLKELLFSPVDTLAWHKGDLLICLPEKTRADGIERARELQEFVESGMGMNLNIGLASFPNDALVFPDLVEAAARTLSVPEVRKPGPVPQATSFGFQGLQWGTGGDQDRMH